MPPSQPAGFVPLPAKLAYTAFVAVLVPYYWHAYGPTNFLYYCDVALLMGLAAAWTGRSLLASAPAVGILVPQAVWMVDFLAGVAGVQLTGMTAYMFNEEKSRFVRGLSFFHFWLPLVLLWFLYRLGYDRRAFWTWATIAWVLMPVCYFLMPGPRPNAGDTPVNINYVHGMKDEAAQTWMHPLAWLALLMAGLPLLVYLPTHLALKWLFRPPPAAGAP